MKVNVEEINREIISLKERIREINKGIKFREGRMSINALSKLKQEKNIHSNRISILNLLIRQSNNTKTETYIDGFLNEIAILKGRLYSSNKNNITDLNLLKHSLKKKLDELDRGTENLNNDQKLFVKNKIDQTRESIDNYFNDTYKRKTVTRPAIEQKNKKNLYKKEVPLRIVTPAKKKVDKIEVVNREPLEEQIITIHWRLIEFRNGHIYISHNGKHVRVICNRSITEFGLIKESHISILKNEFLSIKYDPNTYKYSIEENFLFDKIFNYLEIDQILTNYNIENDNYFQKLILDHLDNQKILKTYKPENHTVYLKYLCDIYTSSYKIVPVKEKRQNESNRFLMEEYAFLFPILSQNSMYIIWESIEEKRATYIFQCKPVDFKASLQKVFDYIASDKITNKRDRLRQTEVGYFERSVVKYYQSINHDNIEDWKKRVHSIISIKDEI